MIDAKLLSVVIPCFNEESTIEQVLYKVMSQPNVGEIIVIDDGSTDSTYNLIQRFTPNSGVDFRYKRQERNMGKGAALATGIKMCSYPIVIIQDADLEYDPQDYIRLITPIYEDRADVVYGSRFASGEERRVLYFWHYIGNTILTLISNAFTNLNLTDMETGYKAIKREFAQSIMIKEKRFGIEPEITAKLAREKARFYEVSISYRGRTYEEGKKIGWKDGFRAIYCIFKYNLFK
jgi:glycosyltransferase involved in cell wall biosynthesis